MGHQMIYVVRRGTGAERVDKLSPNFEKAYKALCFFLRDGRYEVQ